jgi:hypothetical protein
MISKFSSTFRVGGVLAVQFVHELLSQKHKLLKTNGTNVEPRSFDDQTVSVDVRFVSHGPQRGW